MFRLKCSIPSSTSNEKMLEIEEDAYLIKIEEDAYLTKIEEDAYLLKN